MKKLYYFTFFILFFSNLSLADNKIMEIIDGKKDAKINLIVYESLTCSHCASFHTEIYPLLKENFIDKGIINLEFRNFPLDIAALNASKIAHCRNDGSSKILHLLYKKQKDWVKGNSIEDFNENLEKLIKSENLNLNFKNCINNTNIEDYILKDRIDAVQKYNINATPTLIIMGKKFDKTLTYKNIKKAIEKLI
jgi:protein-disulfide isomerase|tara:strand:- start:524 stop:1105 length:582 start_codon:yes stop_codon:yes gene_type:complete